MSKVIGFVIGAALVVAGVVTGNVALIIQGSAILVLSTAVLLTAPKTPARQAAEMALQLGEQPRSLIFGEAFTAGSLVDGFNYGGKYGTDWECLMIRLADHKCQGLTGFYVNDEYVEYTGNGNYPQFDTNHFELYFRADTSTEALPSVLTAHATGWSGTLDLGKSGCDVLVCYRADKPDAKKPAWPGGRPRFGFVVQGKLCYDPRLDDTVPGGAGSHRWDDPDTWTWSDNPAVCRYNWVRGIYAEDSILQPGQLLIGRGLTASEAPPENIFAAANLCDEVVDGEKRYRVAGPIYANQEFIEVEEMFAAATGGTVVTREGSVELEPGASKAVSFTFTDDDIVSGTSVSWNQGILSESSGEWVNTVAPRYVEPTQKWADHGAPVMRDDADILADGRPREAQLTLRLVRWVEQAGRVGEIYRRLGRLWGRAQVTLGPRFCEVEDGDWGTWTSARHGFTKTFRVEGYSIDANWQNKLTLREINADVFGDATLPVDHSDPSTTTPPPEVGTPDDTAWDLTAETIDSGGIGVPALVFTGAVEDPDTAQVIFEVWKDDGVIDPTTDPEDPDWVNAGTGAPDVTRHEFTNIEGGADYYGSVTYVMNDGFVSDRLVLGPVTADALDVTPQVTPVVNSAIAALSWKQSVRVATTVAGTLASSFENGDTVDGVVLATGNRILIKNQAAGAENGIYTVNASGAPTRATDADSAAELVSATVKVSEGTTNADTEWVCTTNAPITLGTTGLTWAPGGSGLTVKEDGSSEGTGITSLNFTTGLDVSVTGTEATVSAVVGGSSGLFAGQLSATPTTAGTGLTNTLGTGATVTNTAAGVLLEKATSGGAGAYTTSVPGTPYSITAMIAGLGAGGVVGLGWTDGTKIQFIYVNSSGARVVQSNSLIGTFAATNATSGTNYPAKMAWLKIRDDGTNVYFLHSVDGVNFGQIYTVAKASGYLGSSGYSHIFFGSPGSTAADSVTMMSWTQGS